MPRDLAEAPPIVDDPDLVVCTACNGYGQRKTPSLAEQYLLAPCTVCSGSGSRDRAAVEAAAQAASYAAAAAGTSSEPPPSYPPPPQVIFNPVTSQWDVIPAPSPTPGS